MRTLCKHRTTTLSGARLGAVACALLAGAALLGSVGCNIVAPVAYLVGGPPKVRAQHKLDSKRPTVVFVDDRANLLPRRSLRAVIGGEVDSTLLEKRVIDQQRMIASQSTMRVAADERYGAPMAIGEVGSRVGAEVVIYAQVERWTLSRDGSSYSPTAVVRVKVLDAVGEQRLWPPDMDGRPILIELPIRTGAVPESRAERNAAEEAMAKAVGVRIARLFFDHERDALSGRLGD